MALAHIHLQVDRNDPRAKEWIKAADHMINAHTVYMSNVRDNTLTIEFEEEHSNVIQELYQSLSFMAKMAGIEIKDATCDEVKVAH